MDKTTAKDMLNDIEWWFETYLLDGDYADVAAVVAGAGEVLSPEEAAVVMEAHDHYGAIAARKGRRD